MAVSPPDYLTETIRELRAAGYSDHDIGRFIQEERNAGKSYREMWGEVMGMMHPGSIVKNGLTGSPNLKPGPVTQIQNAATVSSRGNSAQAANHTAMNAALQSMAMQAAARGRGDPDPPAQLGREATAALETMEHALGGFARYEDYVIAEGEIIPEGATAMLQLERQRYGPDSHKVNVVNLSFSSGLSGFAAELAKKATLHYDGHGRWDLVYVEADMALELARKVYAPEVLAELAFQFGADGARARGLAAGVLFCAIAHAVEVCPKVNFNMDGRALGVHSDPFRPVGAGLPLRVRLAVREQPTTNCDEKEAT